VAGPVADAHRADLRTFAALIDSNAEHFEALSIEVCSDGARRGYRARRLHGTA
jgi:hypothetical protein